MFVDTHAHLYDARIENIEEYVKLAKSCGVKKIVCCGSSAQNSQKAVEIAQKFDNVYATVGVHPEDVDSWNENSLNKLKEIAKNNKVVAVGEIGLDYNYQPFDKEKQKEIFVKQILLADELGLPIVLHCREATGDMLEILKEYRDIIKDRTVMHCFNKNQEVAKILLDLGVCFSIGGALTFPKTEKLKQAIEIIPLEKIMLETDAPYLSPVPFRGQVNNSKNVVIVAQEIAKIKNISVDEVEKQTTINANRFFGLGDDERV